MAAVQFPHQHFLHLKMEPSTGHFGQLYKYFSASLGQTDLWQPIKQHHFVSTPMASVTSKRKITKKLLPEMNV